MIKKQEKGISLIVLVITIIVIVILAGSVILSLYENSPISTANEARFKTDVDAYISELTTKLANEYIKYASFDPNTLNAGVWDGNESNIQGTIKEYIPNITPEDASKFVIQSGKLVYIGDETAQVEYVTDLGISNPELKYPLLGVNVIATVNSTVNGLDAKYNNPIVPKGFKAINDGAIWPIGWNDGLVIEDVNGNQFVWVPIDNLNITYTPFTVVNVIDDSMPAGVVNESDQIVKYQGFYVGRFEAGKVPTNVLVSKKLTTIWNLYTYANSKAKAQSMYTGEEVKSGMVTFTQWNKIMKWIESSGVNVTDDSSGWGNFSNSSGLADVTGHGSLQKTGFCDYWKAKNIYDLAGNSMEWINSKTISDQRPCVSSIYFGKGTNIPYSENFISVASYNNCFVTNPTAAYDFITFRVVLYIK